MKYFISNPKELKGEWVGIGVVIILLSLFLTYFLFFAIPPIFGISGIISGVLFLIFAYFMPQRTEKGTEAYWKALGFKEYIKTAEKYRLQFQEKENIFEEYLPYAITFGLTDKWAKAFEGIYKTPPSWYEGYFGPTFFPTGLSHSLNSAIATVGSIFVSRPGSGSGLGSGFGGGGFSGGGGGGGGGGSW